MSNALFVVARWPWKVTKLLAFLFWLTSVIDTFFFITYLKRSDLIFGLNMFKLASVVAVFSPTQSVERCMF